jgi:hypothetical protein
MLKHRNGTKKSAPCSGQLVAIEAGCKLQLLKKDIAKKDNDRHQTKVKGSLTHAAFDNRIYNQLLLIWLIRNSMPWNRFDDFLLHVTFNYVRHGVSIYSPTWAATKAHLLYMNLQSKVITSLQVG